MADLQPINGEFELRRKLAGEWTPDEALSHLTDPQPDTARKRAVVDQFLANAYDRPLAEIESTRDYWRKEWWGEGTSEESMHADVAGVLGMTGDVEAIEGARAGKKPATNRADQVLSGGLWWMRQQAQEQERNPKPAKPESMAAGMASRESGLNIGEAIGGTLFGKSFASAATAVAYGPMVHLAEYAHLHETAKQLLESRKAKLQALAPTGETADALRAAQAGDLGDKVGSPEWWAASSGQGLGSIMPFLIGGSVVGAGAAGLGAPWWLSSIIAGVAGGTAEASVNAGSAVAGIDERKAEAQAVIEEMDRVDPVERFTRYGVAGALARAEEQKRLNNLENPEMARELADHVFRQNVVLNSVLGAFSTGMGSSLLKRGAAAMAARLPKATGVALLWGGGAAVGSLAAETGQEVGQNVIERKNLDAIARGVTTGAALELWPLQAVRAIINPEAYPEDFDTICATALVAWKGAATAGLAGLGEMKTNAEKARYLRQWTAAVEAKANEGSVYHQELLKEMRLQSGAGDSVNSISGFTANLWRAAKKQTEYVFNRASEVQTAEEIAEINPDEVFSPDEAEEAAAGVDAIAAEVQAQEAAEVTPEAVDVAAEPAPVATPGGGAHYETVVAAVQKIQQAFPDALPVDVVSADAAPNGGVVNGQRVEAFYQKQADGSERLAIVADNITPEQVVKVWAHEQAHRGLELLFRGPEAKAAFLEQVRRSITPDALVGLLPKTGVSAKTAAGNLGRVEQIAAEEYLARLAEKVLAGETLTAQQAVGWQAFKARVAEWVRRTGRALGMNLTYTDRELDELAAMMLTAATGPAAQPQAQAPAAAPAPRSFKAAKAGPSVPSPLVDFVRENGGIRSLKDATNPGGEYDGEADLRAVDPFGRLLGGTLAPDQMAMMARDAGLIPDAYPATLWTALVGEVQAAKRGRAEEAANAVDEKQAKRFDKDVLNDTTNPLRVPVANLRVGDAVQVGSETLTVTDIDADTGDVILTDGKKYGVRQVAGDEVLYVDKAEYAPEDGETRFRLGEQANHKEIDRERLKELGFTTNIKEAGYITPAGKLIDLSGKREGGSPGQRSYDHREAGGTKGMQEFGAEGNIRIDSNSGIADMYAMPTPAQMRWIERLAEEADGLQLELQDGLGEETEDYYQHPKRRWSGTYDADAVRKAAGDIRRFYAGEPMPDEGVRFSLGETSSADFVHQPSWYNETPLVGTNSVRVSNKHHNLFGNWHFANARLLPTGSLQIDGNTVQVGDVLYVTKAGKLVKEIPVADKEEMEAAMRPRIDMLVKLSLRINRDVPRPTPEEEQQITNEFGNRTNNNFFNYDDGGATAWKIARYDGIESTLQRDAEWIDSLSATHSPAAVRDAVVQKEFDATRRFDVGGYLHVTPNTILTPAVKLGASEYKIASGGMLGKSFLEALANPDEWEGAENENRFRLSDTLPPLDEKERTIAGAFAFRMARGAGVTEKTVARRLADVGAMPGKAREVLAAAKDMAAEIAAGKVGPANDEQLLRALSAQTLRERYREKVFSAYANADEARQVYESSLKRINAWEQGKTSRDAAARSGLSEEELSAAGLANLPARLRGVLADARDKQENAGAVKGADVKPPADAAVVEGGEKPRFVRQSPPNDGTRTGEPMTAEEQAALNPPAPPEWVIVDPVSLEEMRTKILAAVEKKLRAEGWTPRGKVTFDPVFLAEYRKTLAGVLRDTVFENVTAGPRQQRLMAAVFALQDREATLHSIDRQALDIVNRTAAALAKADADTFARQIDRLLKLQVLRGPGKSRQELIEKKIHPAARTWLRLVKSIYTMPLDKVDALVNEPGSGLLALRDQYGMGVPADQEAAVRKRLAEVTDLVNREPLLMAQDVDALLDDVIRALRLYGGIRERTPAQIEQAAAELRADFEGGVEKIQQAREERKARLEPLRKAWIGALRKLPAKDVKTILDGYAENSFSLYGQMVDFVRGEKNAERYAEAVAAARELSMAIERADRKAHEVAFDRTRDLEAAIRKIYGTADSARVLRELREPQEKFRQFSHDKEVTRPLSRANLLMILSAWDQKRYRDNLVAAGRSAAEMGEIRRALGMRDLALLDWLRGQYDAFRPEMSALSQEITGLPIISPDPLYHPFVAKRPGKGLSEIHVVFPTLHGGFEARVRHGYDVDESADVIGLYMDRAHSDGRALGAAPLQQDLRYVFGHQDTWQAMERRLGRDVTQGFIDHVTEAVVGRAIKGDRTKLEILRRARYMTTLFSMSYNVGSALRQVAALPGFLVYEDAGTVARASGLFFSDHAAWSAALAEMKADPSYRYWAEHGYNAAVDEVMSEASPNGVARFFRAGMRVPAAGIQFPTALVGPGLYLTYRDRLLARGWQEAAARKEAMAQVTWLINHTQGSAAVSVQSGWWRHGGEAQKALQQFMGPVAQLAEWDLRAVREVKAGTPGAWKRARNVLLVNHVLIPAVYEAMNLLWKGMRGDFAGDDREKELEKAAKEGIFAMLLGPVGGLFLIGPIAESLGRLVGGLPTYGRGGTPMADLVGRLGADVVKMGWTLKETLWDDKDVQEALHDWFSTAGDAAGRVLPPVRDARRAADNYLSE